MTSPLLSFFTCTKVRSINLQLGLLCIEAFSLCILHILSRNSIIQDVQQLIPQIMCPQCNKVTGTIIECSLHGMNYVKTKLSLTKLLQIFQY